MPEPWEALKDEIAELLSEETKNFANELKEAAKDFLREQAAAMAREKWRELHAESEEERLIASSNLRHLRGQMGAEIARLNLTVTKRSAELLERVLSTAVGLLLRSTPKLLG